MSGGEPTTQRDNVTRISCILEDFTDRDSFTPEAWNILLEDPGHYAILVLYLLVFFTAVPLNTVVIVRLVVKRLYLQPTFMPLLNLAICDILYCLIPILFDIITQIRGEYSFGSSDYTRCGVCKIAGLFVVFNFLTLFTLLLIALDRYAFFRWSMWYNQIITSKKMLVALLVIWGISFVMAIPYMAGYGDLVFTISCGRSFTHPSHVKRSRATIVITALICTVIIAVVVVCNLWVLRIGVKQLHKIRPVGPEEGAGPDIERRIANRERAILKKQLKLFYLFGAIIIVHFVTFIPAILAITVISLLAMPAIPTGLYVTVLFFLILQVALHPMVESFFTPELRRIVTRCCGKDEPKSWIEREL